MTDEAPSPASRRERLASARRRRIRVLGVAVVVMVAGGIGTAAALRKHTSDPVALPTVKRQPKPANDPTQPTLGPATGLRPPRALSHTDPMRLWIGGDSLAGSFGPALGQMGGATGVVDATIDYKVSSGLADNGIRDWYDHAQEEMASANPDAVVFIIGTNDASIVNSQDSNHDGEPDWQVSYRQKIDDMMRTFVGSGTHRTVFWLGPPTLRDGGLNRGAKELGRVMREEAKKFAPDVVYVDTYALFADKNGDYSESLTDPRGNDVQMRISDGVHFTVQGAQYLSDAVWRLINKRWRVSAQADPSEPITYTIAPGSGEYVPGVGHYRPKVSSTTTETGTTSVSTTSPGSTTPTTTKASPTTSPQTTPPKTTPTTVHHTPGTT